MGQDLDAQDRLPASLESHVPSSSPRDVVLPSSLLTDEAVPRKHFSATQGCRQSSGTESGGTPVEQLRSVPVVL